MYVPLGRDPCRDIFVSTFLEMLSALDMQVPNLLLGDFNGGMFPDRDFSDGKGQVCPLITRLLGPGGPFFGPSFGGFP